MKFACDSCQAQYMINDEKVGPNGVIVRCKKCQHKIVVKRPAPEAADEDSSESTVVMSNPIAALAPGEPEDFGTSPGAAPEPAPESAAPVDESADEFGLDDELGRAFDSVLSSPPSGDPGELTAPGTDPLATSSAGFPFSSSSDQFEDEDADRQSTRVVNLAEMASMMKPEAAPKSPEEARDPASAGREGGPKDSEQIEWFVAISDQQVGPLDYEGVREKWDSGELSADSLAWHAGMSDWKPLSSVPELADRLVPKHKPEAEPPRSEAGESGAGATGAKPAAAAASSLPPPQAEPADSGWKPSAASALELLVKDELDALDKQPPKPEPAASSAPLGPSGGLFDDLPDELEAAPAPGLPKASEPPGGVEAPPAADPFEEPPPDFDLRPTKPIARAPARRDDYVPPPAYVPAAPPKSRMGLFVALGVGGGLLGVGAIALVLMFVVFTPAALTPPAGDPGPGSPAKTEPVGSQAAAGEGKEPDKAEADKADADKAEVAQADTDKAEGDKQVGKEEAAGSEPPKVADDKEKPSKSEPARAKAPERRAPKETPRRVERRTEPKVERRDPPPRPKEPDPEPTPTARVSKSSVDDDFDRIFGGAAAAPAPEPKKEEKKKSNVYIPPPVGGGSTKETLGQSDIMEVVLANRSAIKRCTDEQKARDPGSSGVIAMRWIIRKNGQTSGIRAMTKEFQKSELSACLAGVIKSFKFPPYTGKQMQPIDFPFKF